MTTLTSFCRILTSRLTVGAGFDAGNGGSADVLGLRWLVGILEQVPNLDLSIVLPNEEDRRPGQGPVTDRTHHFGAGRREDRAALKWDGKLK